MPGSLSVKLSGAGRTVIVRRDPELVPHKFWTRARAEWGTSGPQPNRALEIHTEHFLARLGWLAPACRHFGVSIDWDEQVPALILAHREERSHLDTALGGVTPLDPEAVAERLQGTRFSRELRPFQSRDLGHLLSLAHGANFSVPGAGKTAVQLACFEAERVAGRIEQMLVVAPISAFEAWEAETAASLDDAPRVAVFAGGPMPDAEIVLVNYQRLFVSYEIAAAWVLARKTLVCLDEAHRIKRGRDGGWGSTCLDLAYLADRRDILTGTPAPQSPGDIGVLLDYLWLGQGHRVLPAAISDREPPPDLGAQVAASIEPLFVRTTKADLNLPPIELTVTPVPPDDLQAEIYAALRNRYSGYRALSSTERARFLHMGTIVMYLLEAATNPALLPAGSSAGDPGNFRHPPLPIEADSPLGELLGRYGTYETPTKFVALGTLLQANREAGRKTLVWSNFVRNLEMLRNEFAHHNPAVVHGGVPSRVSVPDADPSRESELDRFRTDTECWVLFANPAAVGEGVSLHTACHDAIYLERTFNAGQYLQSLDRIHRLGLPEDVTTRVTFLVTPETIDTVVADRVHEKAALLGAMLNDTDIVTLALPDEEDFGAPFDLADAADVAALFAHLTPGDD